MTQTSTRSILHRDGCVTYWSVYEQQWRRHQTTCPARELAAMGATERRQVEHHLGYDREREHAEQ